MNISSQRQSSVDLPNMSSNNSTRQTSFVRETDEKDLGAVTSPGGRLPAGTFANLLLEKNIAVHKVSDAHMAEIAQRQQEESARDAINLQYAWTHRDYAVGQVIVRGEVVATVFNRGSFELQHQIASLTKGDLPPRARLEEIAKALGGTIQTDHLAPTEGWGGPGAPEHLLPAFTARTLNEILDEESRNVGELSYASISHGK